MSGSGADRTVHVEPASLECGGRSPLVLLRPLGGTAEWGLARGHIHIDRSCQVSSQFICLSCPSHKKTHMSPATVKTQVPKLSQGVLTSVLFLIPDHVLLGGTFGGTTSSECLHVSVSAPVLLSESLTFHGHLEEIKVTFIYVTQFLFPFWGLRVNLVLSQMEFPVPRTDRP